MLFERAFFHELRTGPAVVAHVTTLVAGVLVGPSPAHGVRVLGGPAAEALPPLGVGLRLQALLCRPGRRRRCPGLAVDPDPYKGHPPDDDPPFQDVRRLGGAGDHEMGLPRTFLLRGEALRTRCDAQRPVDVDHRD